jgi:hypothetical protein
MRKLIWQTLCQYHSNKVKIDNILKCNQKIKTAGAMLSNRIGRIPPKQPILVGMILPIYELAGGKKVRI